jgi:DNA repair protein RadC
MDSPIHRTTQGLYQTRRPATREDIIGYAKFLIEEEFARQDTLGSPEEAKDFLVAKLGREHRETFGVVFLDKQNQVLGFETLFFGTVDHAVVHPREVVKRCLALNATAIILAHNHPSGVCTPSSGDKDITKRLTEALDMVDVAVLDHFIVGGTTAFSFAKQGLL